MKCPRRTQRFIPAGAGNRTACAACCMRPAVHPRWRGEQTAVLFWCVVVIGSSPLARGTAAVAVGQIVEGRFIPAGAGNRSMRVLPLLAAPVHPRWRGEQNLAGANLRDANGSSPLARGTGMTMPPARLLVRFIPAGAGNRVMVLSCGLWLAVHPRWRGEQPTRASMPSTKIGSSPLARGTDGHILARSGPFRFIPAGAGNRRVCPHAARQPAVHPRWRGEQKHGPPVYLSSVGSSPLARGTVANLVEPDLLIRFIPAGAGNR